MMLRKASFSVLINAQAVGLKERYKQIRQLAEWKNSVTGLIEERIKTLTHKILKHQIN